MSEVSSSAGAKPGLISARTIFALLAVAIVAFSGALSLAAWSPELQDKNKAGAHAYSTSATGYKAFSDLLALDGWTVTAKRNSERYTRGLNFVTPGTSTSTDALEDVVELAEANIVILPKWQGRADRQKPSWFEDTDLVPLFYIEGLIGRALADESIIRVDPLGFAEFDGTRYPLTISESLQVFELTLLDVLIGTPAGALAVRDLDTGTIYVSDPDLFNTMGLASLDHAQLALAFTESLSTRAQPITFDVTLNGFVLETSLLRILLDVPFLAVTLVALMGGALLAWAASIRFGSPVRDERAHALGKEALADHTAALFKLARREARMAPGYLALQKSLVCDRLGVPKQLSDAEKTDWLDRFSQQAGLSLFSKLEQGLSEPSRNRFDLIQKTQQLYRWRQEILNETD